MTPALHRRGFLRLLGISAAAIAADPEILLWTPGKKTIFVPPLIETNISLDEINAITQRMIPRLIDNIFMQSPLLAYLNGRGVIIGGNQ